MVVMAISDVLTLNFFWMVKDEGSWLDIGTSISHFCIASALCIFVAGLEFLSEVFVSGVEIEGDGRRVGNVGERKKVNGMAKEGNGAVGGEKKQLETKFKQGTNVPAGRSGSDVT